MKIVIIAGGKGTRISSINAEIPKAMISIIDKPVLEYQIELGKRYGFNEFIIVIGHLGHIIEDYFADGSNWNVNIDYYKEDKPLGTAGALPELTDFLKEDFFVFYGDTIMDIDMCKMLDFHKNKKSDLTMFVHPNDHPYDSDIVKIDNCTRVMEIYNKPHSNDLFYKNLVNAALFIFSPLVLNYINIGKKTHIEKDLIPKLINSQLNVYGYLSHEYIKDMGTPERYYKVSSDVEKGTVRSYNNCYKRKAVFLDRDGVINKEVNLLSNLESFELIEGVPEAIRFLNQNGFLVVVVTNQPVIARNLCSIDDLNNIHAKMETLLGKQGAYLDAIYYCPHHPDRGYPEERKEYKINCKCRKPQPGMILKAIKDLNINIEESIMIGDSITDYQAGVNANLKKSYIISQNAPYELLKLVKQII